ncbi:hypothetical protein EX30DRAFT_341746 [Ascodesmis nigricans]|uniref:Uncharacterized protein n=1 Tax=Ascodesmis nigricans TaxID=341454 RepID=A0A4S2MUL0_9PEZI|nr:hypothetical protein EX30DRAFT_341746 [Ascodesmis nigricans]
MDDIIFSSAPHPQNQLRTRIKSSVQVRSPIQVTLTLTPSSPPTKTRISRIYLSRQTLSLHMMLILIITLLQLARSTRVQVLYKPCNDNVRIFFSSLVVARKRGSETLYPCSWLLASYDMENGVEG